MKKINIFIVITLLLLNGCSFGKTKTEANQIKVDENYEIDAPKYISQEDCENKTGKECDFAMCDIGDCPNQSELGWQPKTK